MVTSNVSILSILLAISLCILSFLLWKISKLKNLVLEERMHFDRNEFAMVSRIVEAERSRISAELHDELGALLSLIYLDLELVSHEAAALTPYAETRLNDIRRNLTQVIEAIRANIWNLSALMFDQVDLAFAIRELCHKLDRYKGTQVTFVQSGFPFSITEEYKINLFRIVQELLTNSIKHSSAWNISVHLHWENSALSITLEDDGVGYNSRRRSQGMGILSISKRAEYLGASLVRESLKRGHRITLTMKILP